MQDSGLTDIQLKMLEKMLEWDVEYRYPYSYFDDIYDKKTLKKEMRGLISGGYVELDRGGLNDDGEVCGGTGFSLNYERIREIRQLVADRARTIETWKLNLQRLLWSYHENGRPDSGTGIIGNPKTIEDFVVAYGYEQYEMGKRDGVEKERARVLEEAKIITQRNSNEHFQFTNIHKWANEIADLLGALVPKIEEGE